MFPNPLAWNVWTPFEWVTSLRWGRHNSWCRQMQKISRYRKIGSKWLTKTSLLFFNLPLFFSFPNCFFFKSYALSHFLCLHEYYFAKVGPIFFLLFHLDSLVFGPRWLKEDVGDLAAENIALSISERFSVSKRI